MMAKTIHSPRFIVLLSGFAIALVVSQTLSVYAACLAGVDGAEKYSLQKDGYCEGFVDSIPGETNSGSFRITAFSLGALREITDPLLVRIPSTAKGKPELRLQSAIKKYFIAELLLPEQGVIRSLSSAKFRKIIPPQELRTLAWINSGNQFYYVPTLFDQKARDYTFTFFSPRPVRIPLIEIVRLRGNKVVLKDSMPSLQSSREIFFAWKNVKKEEAGNYMLRLTIQQEGKSQQVKTFDFSHNPAWLQ
jgi:hypothetical protein